MDALTQLFKGVAGLPADFGEKVETIFKASVQEAAEVLSTTKILEATDAFKTEKDAYIKTLTDAHETALKEATERLGDYAKEGVAAWAEDNKLQLESSLKVEVATEYMRGLKSLMTESTALVGDSKITEVLTKEIAGLKESLVTANKTLAESTKQLNDFAKEKALREATIGLTDVAKDRIVKLAESYDSTDLKGFGNKVAMLVEAFGGKVVSAEPVKSTTIQAPDAIHESTDKTAPVVDVSDEVQATINRLNSMHL